MKATRKPAAKPRAKSSGKKLRSRKPARAKNPRCRRNPVEVEDLAQLGDAEAAAVEMFRQFHGEDPTRATDYEHKVAYRSTLAKLGRLLELRALDDQDYETTLEPRGVEVYCSPDGGQIYFIGGDQALDVDALGLADAMPKDLLTIGRCFYIAYHTTKDFHNFDPTDYEHQLGEVSGELPTLIYDTLNRSISFSGGAYKVKREGIVN